MSAWRERELKFKIGSREGFLSLRDGEEWGGRASPVAQVNHYFDTKDLQLARSRAMLRIREAEECILTLKCGKEVRPGFFDSLELEAEIPRDSLRLFLESPPSLLDLSLPPVEELKRRFGRPELSLVGTLKNERVKRAIDGLVLEVDRVSFPDGSERYELEIETEDIPRAEAWVRRKISGRLKLEPQRSTKLEELLERQRKP